MRMTRVEDRIRPWDTDRRYWQYRGKPVVLMGGSREDNLFQIADLETHLDVLVACGGNFLRNVMSSRDPGDEQAWARRADGKYEVNQWNPAYWARFEKFLELTAERDIIVQIEVWDRFDWSRDFWKNQPLNPRNCASELPREAGLDEEYPEHPSADKQPFFHTVPGSKGYDAKLDALRGVQEAYVDQLLSHTLRYGHVLYCMNNETSSDPKWGQYWMAHIRRRAKEAGVNVCVTDMFDDAYRPEESKSFGGVLADAQMYDFVEISQVNSRNFGADHWKRIVWVCEKAHGEPRAALEDSLCLGVEFPGGRPVNHTKIYSDGRTSFGSGVPQDGIERFWRNLMAGSAAVRFHRPTSGLGLSPLAQACIRSARMVERMLPWWTLKPVGHDENRAYVVADAMGDAVVFLPRGEAYELAWPAGSEARVDWIAIATGSRIGIEKMPAGATVKLAPPLSGPMVAVVRRV